MKSSSFSRRSLLMGAATLSVSRLNAADQHPHPMSEEAADLRWPVFHAAESSLAGDLAVLTPPYAYVGCYTGGSNARGISVFHYDPTTNELTLAGILAPVSSPSFIVLDATKKFLYSGNESGTGSASAFAISIALRVICSPSSSRSARRAMVTLLRLPWGRPLPKLLPRANLWPVFRASLDCAASVLPTAVISFGLFILSSLFAIVDLPPCGPPEGRISSGRRGLADRLSDGFPSRDSFDITGVVDSLERLDRVDRVMLLILLDGGVGSLSTLSTIPLISALVLTKSITRPLATARTHHSPVSRLHLPP